MMRKSILLSLSLLCAQGAWAADGKQTAGYLELDDGWRGELSCTLELRPQSQGGGVKTIWKVPFVSVSEGVFLGATFSCDSEFEQNEVVVVDRGEDRFFGVIGEADSPSKGTFRVYFNGESCYYFGVTVESLGKLDDDTMRNYATVFIMQSLGDLAS